MAFPVLSTYRLQLRGESSGFGFTFADAENLLDYLAELGVSHLYLSPILTPVGGSAHGYDVTDPTTVSAEARIPARAAPARAAQEVGHPAAGPAAAPGRGSSQGRATANRAMRTDGRPGCR